jgi:putative membrane protein
MSKETDDKISEKGPGKPSSPAQAAQPDKSAATEAMKILTGIASALGLGRKKKKKGIIDTGDVGTNLAHQRTDLAMDRNYLAAERTLMAWIRTALSMISFGFTIGKLGQVMHEVNVKGIIGRTRTMGIENIAHFLVILGTAALLGAALQHRHRVRKLYAMGLRHQVSITFIVALALAALGGFALTALVLAI